MKKLPWLNEDEIEFPDIEAALDEPNGLLAAGRDLSVTRLLEAYRVGIFPWYEDDQPILWWSPDPRCVIDPKEFKPSRSLAKKLKRDDYTIAVDRDFPAVVEACRFRGDDEGTWITSEMADAYIELHNMGYAHSIECYQNGDLAGGLYGVSIGSLFFGESMFHRVTDTSKIAFAHLMQMMTDAGCPLVDCQLPNPHLESLGTVEMDRRTFRTILERHIDDPPLDWDSLSSSVNLDT